MASANGLAIVDPHMHLWDLSRHYYSWLQDDPLPNNPAGDVTPIANRSYGIDDYLADSADWDVRAVVHVECGLPKKDQLSETDWLQSLAKARGYPQGIVAGASLDDREVEPLLEAHAARANVRGIRQIINWHADPTKTYTARDLIDDPAWRRGFALLARYGLAFDLQLYPSQMPAAARLAAEHPGTPLIINHAGMPTDRDTAGIEAWRSGMALLAAEPNVAVKISGLGMVDRAWTVDSIRPFVLTTIELFGVDRAMFASNFPVDRVHGAFGAHYGAYDAITNAFSASERARLFGETARKIYRL
jgi:predicted TIM-barrel fold metal-dependent hydrolase